MMEQQPSVDQPLFEVQVDYESGNYFKETVKWTKFIAIVSLICIGLGVLWLLVASSVLLELLGRVFPAFLGMGSAVILIVFLVLAIYGFLMIQLYRFSSMVKAGITYNDQVRFNKGLGSLKNYFLISGIFSVLSLLLSLVVLFIGMF